MIIGIILLLGGIASAIYGSHLNNDLESQMESFFTSGAANPGDIWLYAGIGVAVLGVIIVIARLIKKR